MTKVTLLASLGLGVGVGHGLSLWRLVRRLRPVGGTRRRLLLGALGLRLLSASALVVAMWSATAEAAFAAFVTLWVGRTIVLLRVRGVRD